MKMRWITCLFFLFSAFSCFAADSALNFTPPPTDYSVIFLSNIFGVVDGVLHGTGSQIMGAMFSVFNAAVLALGGIVVMYTLIVGTMNTAHEGQMLGQKWSSIWIPVRSTIGLAFLIPKASGYCLMQIFIMWIVVQGVGAADKVWGVALNYLNRGGTIYAPQSKTQGAGLNDAISQIGYGTATILAGQVCMYGLQLQLEKVRKDYLDKKQEEKPNGPCITGTDLQKAVCDVPVPNLISSVNAVDVQTNYDSAHKDSTGKVIPPSAYTVNMPDYQSLPYPYNQLYAMAGSSTQGICGVISWKPFTGNSGTDSLTANELATTQLSRALGVQQMYSDMMPTSMAIVNNSPAIKSTQTTQNTQTPFAPYAQEPLGVPLLGGGSVCTQPDKNCVGWGADPANTNQQGSLLSGFEFPFAISDYNGIMKAALTIQQTSNKGTSNSFMTNAKSYGWIMAGTYFFDLAHTSSNNMQQSDVLDSSSGLDGSTMYTTTNLKSSFEMQAPCTGLCGMVSGNGYNGKDKISAIAELIDGTGFDGGGTGAEFSKSANNRSAYIADYSATALGFATNASLLNLPGQPGLQVPTFKLNMNIEPLQTSIKFPKKSFSRGFMGLNRALGNAFYNDVFRGIMNSFMGFIVSAFNVIIQAFLYVPLSGMMDTFNVGIQQLSTTDVHPIVALAYMGTSFINYSVDIWIYMLTYGVLFIMIPGSWIVLFMILPFLASWLGVLSSIGFIDAYYVPFLPYMIFLFGGIAWLLAVMEAMVAGPIVALGVTHPEGHDALGKAEQALMILINVFLRPSMMIIGYIGSISLSYVTVSLLNSGFAHVMDFFLPSGNGIWGENSGNTLDTNRADTPYISWAAIYASFFCLVTYTSIYVTVVQKSFTLIYLLPDKVLRWIGGQPETLGADTAQWTDEAKGQVKETGEATNKASMKSGGMITGTAESLVAGANKDASGGSVTGGGG